MIPNHASPPLKLHGAGLGLRRGLLAELEGQGTAGIDFFELAPENWIGVGGALGRRLRAFTERHPFEAHGLSLSLGGPSPLDEALIRDIRGFLDQHGILAYTEHLSYCTDEGHLYDLMPIPFTGEAVRYVAARIQRVQERLERPIAIENVSYYAAVEWMGKEDRLEFDGHVTVTAAQLATFEADKRERRMALIMAAGEVSDAGTE